MAEQHDAHRGADAPEVVIRVIRSGGITGLRRGWRVEAEDVDAWEPVVESCPWAEAPRIREEFAHPEPDRFVWRIEVRAPEPPRTAELPERALRGPWRELVERVRHEGEPVRPRISDGDE